METQAVIKHHKEVHSFYLFILIIFIAIVVLQPLSMLAVVFVNASLGA
jgi:hypothetical protein